MRYIIFLAMMLLASCASYRDVQVSNPEHRDMGVGDFRVFASCISDEFFLFPTVISTNDMGAEIELVASNVTGDNVLWIMTVKPTVTPSTFEAETRYQNMNSSSLNANVAWNYRNLINPCLEMVRQTHEAKLQ